MTWRRWLLVALVFVAVLYVAQWATLCNDCGVRQLLVPWEMWFSDG